MAFHSLSYTLHFCYLFFLTSYYIRLYFLHHFLFLFLFFLYTFYFLKKYMSTTEFMLHLYVFMGFESSGIKIQSGLPITSRSFSYRHMRNSYQKMIRTMKYVPLMYRMKCVDCFSLRLAIDSWWWITATYFSFFFSLTPLLYTHTYLIALLFALSTQIRSFLFFYTFFKYYYLPPNPIIILGTLKCPSTSPQQIYKKGENFNMRPPPRKIIHTCVYI